MPDPTQTPDVTPAPPDPNTVSPQPPTPSDATLGQPTPQMPSQAAPAAPEKPSLWKSVLQGALSGLAGAKGATSFGGGLAGGAAGELEQQQQQKNNAITQQRQNNANQEAQDAHDHAKQESAIGYAHLAQILHQTALMPPDYQTKLAQDRAEQTEQLRKTGAMAPAGQPGDHASVLTQVAQLHASNPARLYTPEPIKGADGNIQWQAMESTDAPISEDVKLQMPDGSTVTAPKGSITGKQATGFTLASLATAQKNQLATSQAAKVKADAAAQQAQAANTRAGAAVTTANTKAAQAAATTGPNAEWKPKVTADEKKKAELAENMAVNAENVAKIIQRRPDILGAIGGRFTNTKQMIGNNDPDISAIGNEVHNMAMANSGVHGFRSKEGVDETEEKILNNFKSGPKAIAGALKANIASVQTFVDNARPETYRTHSKSGGVLKGMASYSQGAK